MLLSLSPLEGPLSRKGQGQRPVFFSASSSVLKKYCLENTQLQTECTAHSTHVADNCPYREMAEGYVHLSQEVVSRLLRREQRVNIPIYSLNVSILKNVFFTKRDEGPGPDAGVQWGWGAGRRETGNGEPKASHTYLQLPKTLQAVYYPT